LEKSRNAALKLELWKYRPNWPDLWHNRLKEEESDEFSWRIDNAAIFLPQVPQETC
jgi:hypothetical protein